MMLGDTLVETPIDCFMFFREGITPEWEDAKNAKGGHFLYQIKRPTRKEINDLWYNIIYELIGETWDGSEHICGLRILNKIKGEMFVKIELWVDFHDKNSEKQFESKEQQKKVFDSLKASYIANLKESLGKNIDSDEVKFEYHEMESSHFAGGHSGGHGGGHSGGQGGYQKSSYNNDRQGGFGGGRKQFDDNKRFGGGGGGGGGGRKF